MNRDQWELFLALNHGWPALWLLTDYQHAREHIVASQHGRSGYRPGTWCQTSGKALTLATGIGNEAEVLVTLPWSVIKSWSAEQTDATRNEARRLSHFGSEHQRAWPTFKASRDAQGCGRPYPHQPPTRAQALYADEHDRYHEQEYLPWLRRQIAHREEVDAFVATLGPDDEPQDLLELLDTMGTS